mgnify:FL=1
MKNEENLYRHLLELRTPFISVGHRPTLVKYHHLILELSESEPWQVSGTPPQPLVKRSSDPAPNGAFKLWKQVPESAPPQGANASSYNGGHLRNGLAWERAVIRSLR